MIGQPMCADGFAALAAQFPERTVITYDPRGLGRSTRTDGRTDNVPGVQAADIHAVIEAMGAGPVDMFASSGGAVTSFALVAAYPDDVLTLVAHEPPLATALPDAAAAERALAGMRAAYRADAAALAAAPTRIVLAVGEESAGTFTARTTESAAALLDQRPVVFPSHHGGFSGEDSPYPGKPEAFAHRLREVLDGKG
jgi:pimeloyl-ACP methyl ester carboxylesterase